MCDSADFDTGHWDDRIAELEAKLAEQIEELGRTQRVLDAAREWNRELSDERSQLQAKLAEANSAKRIAERNANELNGELAEARALMAEASTRLDDLGKVYAFDDKALITRLEAASGEEK